MIREFVLLTLLIVASGCLGCVQEGNENITPTPTYTLTGIPPVTREESNQVAEDYVKNMEEYTDHSGRNLKLLRVMNLSCPNCWSFTYQFDMQSIKDPSVVDEAKVRVIVQEGRVVETFSALGMKKSDDRPSGSIYVSQLLTDPVYEEQVKVYGEVGLMGELFCPCFELTSGSETLQVWYDLMEEEKPEGMVCCEIYGYGAGMEKVNVHYKWTSPQNCTVPEGFVGGDREVVDDEYCLERPAVSVEDIENGDWVVVTGELRHNVSTPTFWATGIEKIPQDYCCKDNTMECMSITEARKIARNSECGDRLNETYICNNVSGTWWIELDIEKEGCNPACVVNITSQQAEINWRCTGLIIE